MARAKQPAVDHHRTVLDGATQRLQELYDTSPQPMYVFYDDRLKSCSRTFAALLGYKDPAEWAAVVEDIPRAFVADESIETVIGAFQACVGEGIASEVPVTWRRKDGKGVRSRTIFVPFDHEGHRMALHFVQPL